MERTKEQIYEQLDRANEGFEHGSKYPGMSYEQGVKAAIEWLIGDIDDLPMEDE